MSKTEPTAPNPGSKPSLSPDQACQSDEAKDYLIRNELWDEDPGLCAVNIAAKIFKDGETGDETYYYATKYGRRAIMALCEIYAAKTKVMSSSKPSTTIPELSTVRTLVAAENIPVGSVGTIVHTYGGGLAYEIEFTFGDTIADHRHAVRTYSASEVETVNVQK